MRTASSVVLVALALVAAIVLSACSPLGENHVDPTKLAALKKEPLATLKLPGGRLLFHYELDADPQPAFDIEGGGTTAELLRVFVYPNDERARKGRAAAVRAARASGWTLTVYRDDPHELRAEGRQALVVGRKKLATGDATLIIGSYRDSADHSRRVSIKFEHTKCGLCKR